MSDQAIQLMHGDCRELLKTLPENSVESVVTDPPYELTSIIKRFGGEGAAPAQFGTDGVYARTSGGFMGKQWDATGIQRDPAFWAEVLRVLKPGGHLLSFGSTRTYHRMACAIEDAGFEIRDQIQWLYATGFPKSLNIGKAMDKDALHLKPQSTGFNTAGGKERGLPNKDYRADYGYKYAPVTDAAKEWEGWGTALKPANEPICLARKPLSESTVAANVLRWGTGGLNIDASRVQTEDNLRGGRYSVDSKGLNGTVYGNGINLPSKESYTQPLGRWPANVIFSPEAAAELDRQSGILTSGEIKKPIPALPSNPSRSTIMPGGYGYKTSDCFSEANSGGASRFFFVAKPSQSERCAGLDDGNPHPTVKPMELFSYLIRLVTPPGGIVLDPFAGSFTAGMAAVNGGFGFIGMEMEADYFQVGQARMKHAQGRTGLFADDE